MEAFVFTPPEREIELNGHKFTFRPGDVATLEAATKASLELKAVAGESFPRRGCRMVAAQIDAVLGQGAYDKIFAGRSLNLAEHRAVWRYINDTILAAMDGRDKAILGPNEPAKVGGDGEPK